MIRPFITIVPVDGLPIGWGLSPEGGAVPPSAWKRMRAATAEPDAADINRALIAGTLGIGENGVAQPEPKPKQAELEGPPEPPARPWRQHLRDDVEQELNRVWPDEAGPGEIGDDYRARVQRRQTEEFVGPPEPPTIHERILSAAREVAAAPDPITRVRLRVGGEVVGYLNALNFAATYDDEEPFVGPPAPIDLRGQALTPADFDRVRRAARNLPRRTLR